MIKEVISYEIEFSPGDATEYKFLIAFSDDQTIVGINTLKGCYFGIKETIKDRHYELKKIKAFFDEVKFPENYSKYAAWKNKASFKARQLFCWEEESIFCHVLAAFVAIGLILKGKIKENFKINHHKRYTTWSLNETLDW